MSHAIALRHEAGVLTLKQNPPRNVDDYIARFPPPVRRILETLRQKIRATAPQAQEVISYGIPAYRCGRMLVYFAAFRSHIGLYPPVKENARLIKAASRYAGPKGNLRFPLDQPIPYDLVERIVKIRAEKELSERPQVRSSAPTKKIVKKPRRPSTCTQ